MQNLVLYKKSKEFLQKLEEFGIVQKGHFEYKGKAEDGTRKHGTYFINYRILTTDQEIVLVPYYTEAIEEFLGDKENIIIVGVAMGSLSLPKVIQLELFKQKGIEYAYTEKRNGILGLFDHQAAKCKGKHLLFIEDVCNNGTSSRELIEEIENKKDNLEITGFSILYGVHRGNTFLEKPEGNIFAMGLLDAPSYHQNECPGCQQGIPLKEYKK